ncbi:MAG: V-type ATP synthase subunit I [Methanobacteriota archaeon]
MLSPEPMTRAIVVGSLRHQRAVIDTLHGLGLAHVVEFREGAAGLALGRPLAGASEANEKLVRVRSLGRHLGLETHEPASPLSARDVEREIGQALQALEVNVSEAAEARDRIQKALHEADEEERRLSPLASLPLALSDYRGYRSIAAFVGTVDAAFDAEVAKAAPDRALFRGEQGMFALFVPNAAREKTQDLLLRHGFTEHPVPEGEGSVPERLAALRSRRNDLSARLAKAEGELSRLRGRYADLLVAADEHLTIEVEKAEAPLVFGSTERAFFLDVWVPTSDLKRMKADLEFATDGAIHVEVIRATDSTHRETASTHDDPPTKYKNPGAAKHFEFFTDLFSRPKYEEIDPTFVLAITFPFFYGFMIGDFGYGTLMMLLGALLFFKMKKVDGARQLGFAFLAAGLVATSTGVFLFADGFGIPLGATHHAIEELDHAGLAHTCANFQTLLAETSWSCIVSGDLAEVQPAVSKLENVSDLLVFSVVVAFAHLGLGLAFGIRNAIHHSAKHAIAKVGWVFVASGFFAQMMYMARFNRVGGAVFDTLHIPEASIAVAGLELSYVTLFDLAVGTILLVATEGGMALLEIPSMLSNILSYTRLAGVAVAKGAMAVAFNSLFLVGMVQSGGGLVLVLVGFLLLLLTQTLVFVLGLLSSGIQAIRLNYVEFFTKFYEGGGKPFSPFGRKRKHTSTT